MSGVGLEGVRGTDDCDFAADYAQLRVSSIAQLRESSNAQLRVSSIAQLRVSSNAQLHEYPSQKWCTYWEPVLSIYRYETGIWWFFDSF